MRTEDKPEKLTVTIYWDAMTWEAAAGFSAVLAAGVVGWRQMAIQGEQARIQRDQTRIQKQALDLEHLKVRAELFDRRMVVYEATREWLDFIAIHGRTPLSLDMDQIESAEQRTHEVGISSRFLAARDQSRFLFSETVWQALCDLWRKGSIHTRLQRRLSHLTSREDPHVVLEQMDETLDRIADVDTRLVDIFGDEIRLTLPQQD